jgi:hypothetical protein
MTHFTPSTIELTGGLSVALPVDHAFVLFSPEGERLWIKEWDPELLYPRDVEWVEGQIFRTREERGDGVWVVTALDRAMHTVEYYRVESDRYVARVRVRCHAETPSRARAEVSYLFVGLTPDGNHDIGEMTVDAYAEKMARWERLIREYLDAR